ncbi:ABC transporter ATP-binding protein [Aliidiomarina haloalkalitolerans]|uniref:Methionine ABC transporter ATP-binding protein n=1 Tax=Aliidiomarina haloalkalitolerans TaxID=859059 RepID=A0A432VTK2_9GAMM|nr:ABC transporter ATP-binding protein [Aliidiomarina haloalkalitolerans]RUO19763.1 methionine ABC transporter ATP-binding protein [Aliidiomarina haloalkalitolerans]
MAELCIAGQQIEFCWPSQSQPTLRIPELSIRTGERILLRGPSGSGKSTLLSLLAGVNQPTSGTLTILGTELHRLNQRRRDKFRADHIGYIFQQFNLLPYLSVYRNVLLACDFSAARKQKLAAENLSPEAECERLLTHLNIPKELWRRQAATLSVGQQQRVAVARALIGKPELIIADEPTSALDTDARDNFLSLLQDECQSANITLVFVTHDATLSHHFDRTIELTEINQTGVSA